LFTATLCWDFLTPKSDHLILYNVNTKDIFCHFWHRKMCSNFTTQ